MLVTGGLESSPSVSVPLSLISRNSRRSFDISRCRFPLRWNRRHGDLLVPAPEHLCFDLVVFRLTLDRLSRNKALIVNLFV